MSDEAANNLAVKIARLLQTETQSADSNSLQSSIEKINQRLTQIESKLNDQISGKFIQPLTVDHQFSNLHSSQEKFSNLDELADQSSNNWRNEKACPYEPTGKPCDHCSMCNSRGF